MHVISRPAGPIDVNIDQSTRILPTVECPSWSYFVVKGRSVRNHFSYNPIGKVFPKDVLEK